MSEVRSSGRERKPTSKPGAATDDDIADALSKKPKAASAIPPAADAPQRASLARGEVGFVDHVLMRSAHAIPETSLASGDVDRGEPSFAELAIEQAPPADAVPLAMPALPALQLTDFDLVDASGRPVALHWLHKLLGAPGATAAPAGDGDGAADGDGDGESDDDGAMVRVEVGSAVTEKLSLIHI